MAGRNMSRDLQIFSILTCIVLGMVFSPIILSGSINVGQDLSYIYPSVLQQMSIIPQAWEGWWGGGDLGHAQWSTLWLAPAWSILSLFGRLGMSWQLIVKVLVGLFLIVGIWGWWKWGEFNAWNIWARWTAAVLYFVNTYFLVTLDGGSLFIAGAYSCVPVLLWLSSRASLYPSWWNQVVLGFVVGVAGFLDIRIIFIYLTIASLAIVSRFWSIKIMPGILTMLLLLHSFWWFPALVNQWHGQSIDANSSQVNQFSFMSPSHLLFWSQPHWYNNLFGDIQAVRGYLAFIPILVLLSLLTVQHPSLRFFIALTIAGLILAKGELPPGGQLYSKILGWLPGFAGFRDPSKFEILRNLGYTGLIALLMNSVNGKWLAILIVTLTVLVAAPAYTGKMSGMFSPPAYLQEYQMQADFLQKQSGTFRVLWLPTKPPMGYASQNAIWTEGMALLKKKPFLDAVDGEYEYLNYLRSPQMPSLLSLVGVKYIVYPHPEDRKKPLHPDEIAYYAWFRNWFENQTWLKDVSFGPKLGMFEVLTYEPSNFIKLSPTRYKTSVKQAPQWLIFPESFDKGWQLNGKQSESYLEMLNSFYVENPGEYVIEYIPQKILTNAVALSLLAAGLILVASYGYKRIFQYRKA